MNNKTRNGNKNMHLTWSSMAELVSLIMNYTDNTMQNSQYDCGIYQFAH